MPGSNYPQFCAEPPCGQLNPASNLTYDVLEKVFSDIIDAFPDRALHLGFDEINFPCWKTDPQTKGYMAIHSMTTEQLLREFYTRERALLRALVNGTVRTLTFWEEEVAHGLLSDRDSRQDTVQLWSNTAILDRVLAETEASVIVSWSKHYYLDCGRGNIFGDDSWCDPFKTAVAIFAADPLEGFKSEADMNRAIGGEACLQGELVGTRVSEVAWPRAAAYGARLWNYEADLSSSSVALALDAHAARLRARGVPAAMVTSRFCSLEPELCFGPPMSPTPVPSSMNEEMAEFQGLVVGLSLLTGALTAWTVSCVITKLRRRKAGDYMSLDPSATRISRPASRDYGGPIPKPVEGYTVLGNNGRSTPRQANAAWSALWTDN